MYHSFLIHLSADGHLGCFHVLPIINSAAMNIGVHVSLSDLVSSTFFMGSVSKESACNMGDLGSFPGSGRSPGEGNGNSLLCFFLENSKDRGQGYSPWGHKESDMTE